MNMKYIINLNILVLRATCLTVIPAKAGIYPAMVFEIPACAGMTYSLEGKGGGEGEDYNYA